MSLETRLRSFLEEKLLPFKEARRSFILDCPSCGKEEHFWVRKSSGHSICFKCGSKFSWRYLIAALNKSDVSESYSVLFGHGGGDWLDRTLNPEFEEEDRQIFQSDKPIIFGPDFISLEKSQRALDYLTFRGIRNVDFYIKNYNLKYHAEMDAVVFPVSKDDCIYGWQARRIDPQDGELRLISASGFNKGHFFLNWDRASSYSDLILVEGPFDCLKVDISSFYGPIASFGKSLSQDQIRMLLRSRAEKIYIGLDPDASEEVYELISFLGIEKRIYRILPPESKKDFGECDENEIFQSIEKAVELEHPVNYLNLHLN